MFNYGSVAFLNYKEIEFDPSTECKCSKFAVQGC